MTRDREPVAPVREAAEMRPLLAGIADHEAEALQALGRARLAETDPGRETAA